MTDRAGMSLFARIAWAIVVGFAVVHAAGVYFYGHDRMVANARTFAIGTAERGYALDQLLGSQPELLPLLQYEGFELRRVPAVPTGERRGWPHNDEVIHAVRTRLGELGLPGASEVDLWYAVRRGPPRLQLYLPSAQGGWLEIIARTHVTGFGGSAMVGATMTLLLLLVVGVVLLITRRMSKQLGRFVVAAEQVGSTPAADPLPETVGPRELRRASIAFNNMRTRVADLLNERAAMLAAMSHDLRTLATRIGLRLEYVADVDQRDKARHDLTLMTDILDQALRFTQDEHTEEEMERLDMSSLLQSLVDDRCDASPHAAAPASFTGPAHLVVEAQPVAVARLFGNLVDNAIKYGGSASVTLDAHGVTITDPGGGFDPDEAALALKPYTRLDRARSQNQPGTGLGLSIAANVCQRHGWALSFARGDAGFSVRVDFENREVVAAIS